MENDEDEEESEDKHSNESAESSDSAENEQIEEPAAPAKKRRHRRGEMKEAAEIEVVREGEDSHPYRSYFDMLRKYKIQEVIRRNQILLVQVVKEERGNKGAALTTYLSLAGRYCVLMPNNARGGGVSRKISNIADRHKLKAIVNSLPVPDGMSVILRTAGRERTKVEIRRDYEYLIKTWVRIRDMTMASVAPCLIHEEGNLIRRSIRDIYTPDISEILIEGENEFKAAKDFVKMIIPAHARKVKCYRGDIPLFHRYQVETQLEMLHNPIVQLKSGGYLVINPTEALVAIDVNSGRSTKEHSIEDTALKTNLEAVDEVARQLRLRDLAGLIVIDLIDMEEPRNNITVERRMREALRRDRARIQLARINGFGLMEISRQRLHSSFIETSYHVCPYCQGTGVQRSIESVSVHILRLLEEEASTQILSSITVTVPSNVALYILNHKRDLLTNIEKNYNLHIVINGDDGFIDITDYRLEKTKRIISVFKEDEEDLDNETEEEESEETVTEEDTSDSDETDNAEEEQESNDAEDEQPKQQERKRRQPRGLYGRRRQKYLARREEENHTSESEDSSLPKVKDEEVAPVNEQAEVKETSESETSQITETEKPKRRGRPKKNASVKETSSDENKETSEENTLIKEEDTKSEKESKDKSLIVRKTTSVIEKAKGAIILFSSHNMKRNEEKKAENTEAKTEEVITTTEEAKEQEQQPARKRRGRKPKSEQAPEQGDLLATAESTSKKPAKSAKKETAKKSEPAAEPELIVSSDSSEPNDSEEKKKKGGWWARGK